MNHTVYLSLGSNLGDRHANLEAAIHDLHPVIRSMKCSSIYETPPWGYEEQPSFLNMVLAGETKHSPRKLLKFLKSVERKMGREESFRYGPRLIDMDILFYDQRIYSSKTLSIPHPRMTARAFVLVPLNEIAPNLVHPILHLTISELLKELDTGGITLFSSPLECCNDSD
jgi:2-amino-4-hydroxy-6-hydroxymethyldihydropteridine diphosphokinase